MSVGTDPSVDDVKLSFKRRSLKGRKKLCPRCLGELRLTGELSGWLLPEEYFCEKCGYRGHVALEHMPKDTQMLMEEGSTESKEK